MARLIDADELKSYIDCGHLRPPIEKCFSELDVVRMLDKQPTIDAEPVLHGRWIVQKVEDIRTKFYCSECERCVWCGNYYFMKPTEYVAHVYPYCHCGAKMDGGAEDG